MTMHDSVMAWKPKNSSTWIYNPDPDWLDHQSPDEIDTIRMIRADIAEELARALEGIARTKYGLQCIMEDYEGEEYEREAKEYFSKLCSSYEKAARAALARFRA